MLVEFDSVQMRGMKKIFIDAGSIVSIADIPQNLGTSCRVQYADNQSVDVAGSASDAAGRVNDAITQTS